jgi:hypothetical protein
MNRRGKKTEPEGQHTKAVLIETTHNSHERSLYLSMLVYLNKHFCSFFLSSFDT